MRRPSTSSLLAIPALLLISCTAAETDPCKDSEANKTTECSEAQGTTTEDPAPQDLAPKVGTGPTFSAISTSGLTVSWSAATDSITPEAALAYQLISAEAAADLDTIEEALAVPEASIVMSWSAGTLSKVLTGLTPSRTIAYAVLVRDEVANIALYEAATVTTVAAAAPTTGTAISFSGTSLSGFTAAWGGATSSLSSGANLEYRAVLASSAAAIDTIAEAQAVTGSDLLFDWTKNILTVPVTGRSKGTTYALTVLVRDEKGSISIYSPEVVTTLSYRLIFLTSNAYSGAQLSPPATADALCNSQKPAGRGTFKAMLVSTDRFACSTIDCAGGGTSEQSDWVMIPNTPYENHNGQTLWTTNAAGIVPGNPQHPGIYPQTGNGIPVWTGLDSGWRNSLSNCQDWTSSSSADQGFIGVANYGDSATWTFFTITCNQVKQIYCVEQ